MFNDNTYVKVNVCTGFFRIWFSPVAFIVHKNPMVLDTNDTYFCLKNYQIAQLIKMGRVLISKVTNGTQNMK